jgi:hypothetical protein
VMTPCALGERCSFDAGSPRCVLDPTAPACKPGSSVCVDSDTALHCSRDGSGYSVQSCPPTAPCVEGGCRGPVCTVGESRCQGFPNPPLRDVVLNCRDGESWEQVTCAPQELCVFDGIAPGDAPALANWWGSGQGQPPPVPLPFPLTASCQPSNCLPFSGSYALAMCGDPTDPAHDSNQYLSRCEGYPPFSGYAWVPYRCPEPTECVTPRSSAVSAYCGSSCLPGDVRCSGNRLGLETCGGSGEWDAAPEACENGRLCAINEGTAACIDPECAYFMLQEPGNGGRCETVSAFRPCGRDGLLRDVDPTCKHCEIAPSAVFVPPVLPSYRPGTCTGPMGDDQCKLGDRYCTSTDQYWECEGPDWSGAELHRCPAGNQCFVTIDPLSGASRATCAECEPLSAACNEDGSIAYCDRNGRLQGPSPCPVGTCQWGIRPDGSNGFGCRTQCVPGAIQCVSPTQYQKCGVDGRFGPTSFTCENGNLCHLGGDGTTDVGCVQCAGPSHDRTRSASGLPDSRCVGNALSECQLDDTWGPPHECTDNTQCQQAGTGEDGTWVWANCAAL